MYLVKVHDVGKIRDKLRKLLDDNNYYLPVLNIIMVVKSIFTRPEDQIILKYKRNVMKMGSIPGTYWHEFHKEAETKHPKHGNPIF